MAQGLSVSRVVNVSVSLSALLAQAVPIDTCLLLGSSDVINVVQRMREYTTLAEVATDFGTTAPEYLGALAWFGQSPQPTTLFIGRWAQTATNGMLIGGPLTAPNLLISTWTAVTNGAFIVSVDGSQHALSGLSFASAANLNGVASVIQTALQAAGASGATVVYNATYDTFTITSGTTGTTSTVSFLTAPRAVGSATFSGQPAGNDTLTINGTVVTFVSATPTGNQVLIGSDLAGTLENLLTFLSGSTDTNLALMTYTTGPNSAPTALYIAAKASGTAGDTYTLAATSTAITVSGATLSGGSGTDISGMMAGLSTSSGAYLAPGIAAETALAAVQLFDSMFAGQWYGLVVVSPAVQDSDHEAIAAYVEAANPPHFYGITSQEGGVIVPGDTSDIAYVLSQLKYNKTGIQYSSTSAYAICSMLARILTTNWLGQNTAITLKFKSEPGIAAETLNTTQADAAEAKNCNVYVNYNNNTAFIEQGVACSGQFIDTVIGADWLSGNIQTDVFNALFGSPTKVPQTDAGMTVLVNAAEAACIDGVNNGYLGPGLPWNQAGFGTLKQGDILPKGFYVYAPPMALQSEALRQTRAAPVMQIAAKTAGAIHSSDILLYIQQ